MQSPKHPRRPRSLLALATSLTFVATATAQTTLDRAIHIANRAGFGPSPATVSKILGANSSLIDAQNYINDQLNFAPTNQWHGTGQPEIAAVEQGLALPTSQSSPSSVINLGMAQIAYATFTEYQLREVMAQFWERHFNTALYGKASYFIQKGAPDVDPVLANYYAGWFEWEANQEYRANAFGDFESLLQFTAMHPSMVIYLNLPSNKVQQPGDIPNEDFARELLELHTTGPEDANGNPNYTQADIVAVAQIFSGWSVAYTPASSGPGTFAFKFESGDHDQTLVKTVFSGANAFTTEGIPIGLQEGIEFLRHLAQLGETKRAICTKLATVFLGNALPGEPSSLATDRAAVIQAGITAWTLTSGNMKEVVRSMLLSNEFLLPTFLNYRARTPLKAVCAPMRALGATVLDALGNPIPGTPMLGPWGITRELGLDLFEYPAPDGYPDETLEQISSTAALQRMRLNHALFADPIVGVVPKFDFSVILAQAPTPRTFAQEVLTLLYGTNHSANDEDRVVDAIVNAWTANPNTPDVELAALGAAVAASMAQSGIE